MNRIAMRGLVILLVAASAGLTSCGGGGGTGSQPAPQSPAPPAPPPPPPPPPVTAARWEVSLASSGPLACFTPNSSLPLTVAAFTASGDPISSPQFQVASNVPAALEPDGSGGWILRGEGATQFTVTYMGQTAPGATIQPVVLDVLRDGTPPQITIDSPARGAMVAAAGDVRVEGTVVDATSPVQSLTVNGAEQITTPGQNTAIAATPAGRWGLNVIDLVATDSCGNRATLSQSYLRSEQYRPAATAANPAARIARGQSIKLTQGAIDDRNRADIDDVATVIERFLQRNLSNAIGDLTGDMLILNEPAGCPGVGYRLSIAPQGVSITNPRVRELELQTGSMLEDLDFERAIVPLRLRQVTRVGFEPLGCADIEANFSPVYSARVSSLSTSTATIQANGRADVNIPSINVTLSEVDLSVTGVALVDSFLTSAIAPTSAVIADQIENVVVTTLPPLIEQALNTPLTATATIPGGPFGITLSAIAGVDGISFTPAATTESAYTQIHPSRAGTPYAALGAIARATSAANLVSRPGPVTYAIDDNLTNQGLWALWHAGGLEIGDVIGMPGASLRVSGLLPPVLMPGTTPGRVVFGVGDLDVTLSLGPDPEVLPPTPSGTINVEAYVSYVSEALIAYAADTQDLRLETDPADRDVYVHVLRITDGTNEIADGVQRAQIEEYARRLISASIERLTEHTLVATMLPPTSLQLEPASTGGVVDVLHLRVSTVTRAADHLVIDLSLTAEEPPNAAMDGTLTLNNPWTLDDVVAMGMAPVYWPFLTHLEDGDNAAVASKSVEVRDYRLTKLPACEQARTASGEIKCLPKWEFPLNYGYYCGAGRPVEGFLGNPRLDPVDYCCRLHDQNLFGAGDINQRLQACGFVMCLTEATGTPADITARLPEVARARRAMFGMATALCQQLVPVLPEPEIVP